MSVGRQWVRRLGLLLAAGMVVQAPALVGVGTRILGSDNFCPGDFSEEVCAGI
jgi:hypothetical protein